jgi:hypothetical protein
MLSMSDKRVEGGTEMTATAAARRVEIEAPATPHQIVMMPAPAGETRGNPGYLAGIVARLVESPAKVTFRRPVPARRTLDLVRVSADRAVVRSRYATIAEVVRAVEFDVSVPDADVFGFIAGGREAAPTPVQQIAFSPVSDPAFVAGTWSPPVENTVNGFARRELIWTALERAGEVAALAERTRRIALTEITSDVRYAPATGEPTVVIGWGIACEGTKTHTGAAMLGADGVVLARSYQTWIDIP